jgi:chromosome segregation ATPase
VTAAMHKVRRQRGGDDPPSRLKRRRRKAQAAKAAAEAAQTGVAELDTQLNANAAQSRKIEVALQRTRDEAARLRKTLKAAAKDRAKLRSDRKKARRATAKAQQKAHSADAKYDQIVLTEMVRREKERDLSDASRDKHSRTTGRAADNVPSGAVARKAIESAPTDASNSAARPPKSERPDLGTATATRTAARKTAEAGRGQ